MSILNMNIHVAFDSQIYMRWMQGMFIVYCPYPRVPSVGFVLIVCGAKQALTTSTQCFCCQYMIYQEPHAFREEGGKLNAFYSKLT